MPARPTERFSNRVRNYVKYRPSYPDAVFARLRDLDSRSETKKGSRFRVADIGAGTGIFTGPLLDFGWHVTAIEPNKAMREAADSQYSSHREYTSIDATAESTTLPDASVDLITAAQAFHWFRIEDVRREFQRILTPDGQVALIWNERKLDSPFLQEYESFLVRYATDYNEVRHENVNSEVLGEFFVQHRMESFPNSQHFDLPGLLGRLESSSYAPPATHPNHAKLVSAVAASFDRNQEDGQITFGYDARLYVGRV